MAFETVRASEILNSSSQANRAHEKTKWPQAILSGARGFCQTSNIHGLTYIADGPALKVLAWVAAIAVSVSFAIAVILATLQEFSVSKVITTVGRAELPVTEVQVCHVIT